MKKLLIVLLMFLSLSVFAKEFSFYESYYYQFNETFKTMDSYDFNITYESDANVFFFVFRDLTENNICMLNMNQVKKFRTAVEKYFEWNTLAKEKETTLSKEIPDSSFEVHFMNTGREYTYSNFNFPLKFFFFSQNIYEHQFVITSEMQPSIENRFVKCSMDYAYFDYDMIKDLYDVLSDENIQKKKQEFVKKAEIEDLFN